MIRKIIKIEIFPDEEQKKLIDKEIRYSRFVYNHFAKLRHDLWYDKRKNISYNEEIALLKKLRKEEGWLKNVEKASLEQAIRDLDCDFFNLFKNGGNYPRFRRTTDEHQWYKTRSVNNNIKIHKKQNFISLPVLDLVKIKTSESLNGKVQYVKINKIGDKYEALLTLEIQ